jgi:hypothetical protein
LEVAFMIARAKGISAYQDRFLEMLPLIREQASHAFRNEPPSRRQELISEVVANCWVAYVRLIERGLHDVIYASPLARFAIKQVRDGRRVGAKLNVLDVSSRYCQRAKGVKVERLDVLNDNEDQWREIVIEDKRAGPAETAAARIDIGDWFASLPRKKRRIAKLLATGESTSAAARKFRVSHGRISQTRRELLDNWQAFVADDQEATVVAPA